jgi:hypothetical protein
MLDAQRRALNDKSYLRQTTRLMSLSFILLRAQGFIFRDPRYTRLDFKDLLR